jgi:hypothetical protein
MKNTNSEGSKLDFNDSKDYFNSLFSIKSKNLETYVFLIINIEKLLMLSNIEE